MGELLKCPKCGSTQLTSNKKGFSGGKALAGAVVAGGVGLLAGTIGSGKVEITCLKCGKKFKAGEYQKEKAKADRDREFMIRQAKGQESFVPMIVVFFILSVVGAVISYNLLSNDWNFFGIIFTIGTIICAIITAYSIYSEVTRVDSSTKKEVEVRRNKPFEVDKKLEIDNTIREYVRKGQFINAIQYCMRVKNVTEQEAKNYVDSIASKQ